MSGDIAAPDRPLVTFALFAYNQEQYIREAIEGAFAQTYEPLEIILSDDCSTDRTFEIMQEMAAAYEGPHEIKVRRSEVNFGTALHVAAVAKMARGGLFVVAAGDDISVPHRTAELVKAWLSHGKATGVLHSRLLQFSETAADGRDVPLRYQLAEKIDAAWFLRHRTIPFMAPTSAYSSDIFESFDQLLGGSIIEDGPLAIRCLAIGSVIAVDQCLVLQRRLPQTAGTGYSANDPVRWNRLICSRIITSLGAIRDIEGLKAPTADQRKLSAYFAKSARHLGLFVLHGDRGPSGLSKLAFMVKLALFYPTSGSLYARVRGAAGMAGLGRAGRSRSSVRNS